ncbi:hypothetical protein BDW22DRAFT_1065146 [Trametopsis cervina]|nr:hypothetical protein BDW22DRAFT_1065146 [Trametopsis cervina]
MQENDSVSGPDIVGSSTPRNDFVMERIVMVQYTPLSAQLSRNPDSIKTMAREVIGSIHDLRYEAHVLHRDIKDNTIMHTVRDGADHFVLIDFDRSVEVNSDGQPKEESFPPYRTPALPFMAWDMVLPARDATFTPNQSSHRPWPVDCVRHDFESLFWLCLWYGIKTRNMLRLNRMFSVFKLMASVSLNPLADWLSGGEYAPFHDRKSPLFHDWEWLDAMPLSASYEHLRQWFVAFSSCFAAGYAARRAYRKSLKSKSEAQAVLDVPVEAYETWFGHVTRDALIRSLDNFDLGNFDYEKTSPWGAWFFTSEE